jgi:hypothetical protein
MLPAPLKMGFRVASSVMPCLLIQGRREGRGAQFQTNCHAGQAQPDRTTSPKYTTPVGAAEGCDLLILKKSKDRSLRQLLQGIINYQGIVSPL